MYRLARHGLVAALICGAIFSLTIPQTTTRAGALRLSPQVFLPGIIRSSPFWSQEELQAVDLFNQQRQANGCPSVELSYELSVAAKQHSMSMAGGDFVSHTGLNGSTFVERAKAANYLYQPSGEIIAAGQPSASAVVSDWLNSAKHASIMLSCANDDMGIGFVSEPQSRYGYYWTAVFGQR